MRASYLVLNKSILKLWDITKFKVLSSPISIEGRTSSSPKHQLTQSLGKEKIHIYKNCVNCHRTITATIITPFYIMPQYIDYDV